jgi:hypothetical protein
MYQENGTVILIPELNWNGQETLRFFAFDGYTEEINDSVNVNIIPVNDPPGQAKIILPNDGIEVSENKLLNFSSSCFDPDLQYGDILTFRWTSYISGEIGTGENLYNISLDDGEHLITLKVTDKEGEVASDSININVIKYREPVKPGPSINTNRTEDQEGKDDLFVTGMVIIIILAIIIIVIFIALKRKKRPDSDKPEEEIRVEPQPVQTEGQPPVAQSHQIQETGTTYQQDDALFQGSIVPEQSQELPTTPPATPEQATVQPVPETQPLLEPSSISDEDKTETVQYTTPIPPVSTPPQVQQQPPMQQEPGQPTPQYVQQTPSEPPPPICPDCNSNLIFIDDYNCWYCVGCNEYIECE